MQNITSVVTPIALTVGPPALLIIINPYVFLALLSVVMPLFVIAIVHIVRKCADRDKRLDALATRAIRRAHARHIADSE